MMLKMEIVNPKDGEIITYKNPYRVPVFVGSSRPKENSVAFCRKSLRLNSDNTLEVAAKEIFIFVPSIFPNETI